MIENIYKKDHIRTRFGNYVNVFDPDPDTIDIRDIAWSLSRQVRFAAHLPVHYSVAQHCVLASEYAPPGHKLDGLLHDATEAYLLDLPKPIKNRIPQYVDIENNLMRSIAQKFGTSWPLSDEVKKVDKFLLEMEWQLLMLRKPVNLPTGEMITKMEAWPASVAGRKFLRRFQDLKTWKN